MLSIKGHIRGNVIVEADTDLYGHIRGDVVILNGNRLVVHGCIRGNILIQRGAAIDICGRIDGHILNRGTVRSFGMIRGELVNDGGEVHLVNCV